ncbi:MFS transporter [Kitasatospora sp. NPDC058218]|uniref:MFS transporter n=1 Tax=Kitasatospora sp. NPDC058218 TaxID=3346385 RepID=UPI0036D9E30B
MTGTPSTRGTPTATALRTPAPATGRYRWVVLGTATYTQAATCFFVQGIGALGVVLRRELDLSATQLGLLLSAAQLVPLVGLPVAGELLDRFDERRVVGVGAGVVAAGLALGSLAPDHVSLLLALLVVGAGYSTAQPGGSAAVASWFDPSRRGLAMGVRQAGLPLGGALAAAGLPVLAEACGLRVALLAGSLVALSGAIAFVALYRRPPGRARRDGAPQPAAGARPGRRRDARLGTWLVTWLGVRLRMLREPSMVRISLSGAGLVSVQCGIGVLTVLHLHDTTSLGTGRAALVLVVAQGAGVVGRIGLAAWSDRRPSGRHGVVVTCMAAVIAGMTLVMTPLAHAPVAAGLLFGWLGFFGIGWYGPWVAHVVESAPPGRTGLTLGLAMATNQVAVVLVPPALGLITDATHGFAAAWGFLVALTAFALAATARSGRRDRRGAAASAARPSGPR